MSQSITYKNEFPFTFIPPFFYRTNTFHLSLNGQDFLDDDSVLLTDLGIVNGDLIYVVANTERQEDVQTNQTITCTSRDHAPSDQSLCHQGLAVEHDNNPSEVNLLHYC